MYYKITTTENRNLEGGREGNSKRTMDERLAAARENSSVGHGAQGTKPLTWQQRERTEESADAPTSIYAARRGALGGERVDVSACAPHDRQGSPDEAWPHGAGDKIDAGRVIAIPRLFGGRRARSASGSPGPLGHGPSRSAIRLVKTPFKPRSTKGRSRPPSTFSLARSLLPYIRYLSHNGLCFVRTPAHALMSPRAPCQLLA